MPRDTREGWPLLNWETEANGDSRSTYTKVFSLVGSLGSRAGTRDFCAALVALVGPVQKYHFPRRTYTISLHLSSSPSKLRRQSCCVAFLLLCVYEVPGSGYDTTSIA
jgi:hypothetical protein